ncbi:hypothetical protein ACFU7X_11555 [Streptomyces chartreusis]|uniref:hypothetical protein n=1 Tax=Streptomyces chartreusis TaxID=1969 RepID=UPI0036979085
MPSKQTVNGVSGRLQARDVRAGCRLWALDGWRTVQTTVTAVEAVKAREVVEVETDRLTFIAAPDQMLGTPDGWVHARDSEGTVLAWTAARKLCRERLTVTPGYEFGYLLGANCSDGTVGKNYVSLVVNDEGFAARFAACLTAATGLPARLEAVTRPSGYLKRDVPGFRVRVVSSYLADLMRQYVGGDAHHMRQRFPRVVLRDRETFEGFLDGYTDGDGFRPKTCAARLLVSSNVDGSFKPERHHLQLVESAWAEVREVRLRGAGSTKPFTLYSYRLDPYPGFLVNGHLARQPW